MQYSSGATISKISYTKKLSSSEPCQVNTVQQGLNKEKGFILDNYQNSSADGTAFNQYEFPTLTKISFSKTVRANASSRITSRISFSKTDKALCCLIQLLVHHIFAGLWMQ